MNLSAAVGNGGVNTPKDVRIVQERLNLYAAHLLIAPLSVDGITGPKTLTAIEVFQIKAMRFAHPDVRVDVNGSTWRRLSQAPFENLGKQGIGFYTYEDSTKLYGTPTTIASVKKLARSMKSKGVEIGVGDISLILGGPMLGHKSHQEGKDVDLRPLRKDKKNLRVTIQEKRTYSSELTKVMVEELRKDPNLELILFNDVSIPGVKQWDGHDNHLHVRFRK